MYGLINKAIAQMVCEGFGEENWQKILKQAQITDTDTFISMKVYPDDLTHRLIHACSLVLKKTPREIMDLFGQYWIIYTAEQGHKELLEMAGDTLPEFLENLDEIHARVGLAFPKLQPPSFECCATSEETLDLHYYSHREGFAPLAIGLIKGLSRRFETKIEVQQVKSREEGHDHDQFYVTYQKSHQND